MDDQEFRRCIHPKELPRFLLASAVAAPVGAALVVYAVMTQGFIAFVALAIVASFWIGFRILYAALIGNAILVSELNFPRVQRLIDQTRESIGVKKKIHVFIFDNAAFGAVFTYLFGRYAIFLNSSLLEENVNDKELRWIIGRFVGRVKSKRRLGVFNWLIEVAERVVLLNFFLLPYERATAYSGDRIALADIGGDISAATAAMNKVYVGGRIGYAVNPAGVVEQARVVSGSVFALLARLFSAQPPLTDRYIDLIGFARRQFPQEYRRFLAENPSFPAALDRPAP